MAFLLVLPVVCSPHLRRYGYTPTMSYATPSYGYTTPSYGSMPTTGSIRAAAYRIRDGIRSGTAKGHRIEGDL